MIQKFDVIITPFQLSRTIHLYLPDDYDQSDERYPVVYMYDGHNLFYDGDATYGRSWRLKNFLDQYDKKMIVVGMECNHEGTKRLDEYCPYSLEHSHLGTIHGQGHIYMDWVIKELKPYIDAHYRTIPFRECTMIAGSSMGGLMSIYTIVTYNQYFSKAACLSSSVSLCLEQLKQTIHHQTLCEDTRIYMDWGSEESRGKNGLVQSSIRQLSIAHALTQQGAKVFPYLVDHGHHDEATWETRIPIFMDLLWK